ncbi:MAG: methionine--tRNA ligase [Erysipelotrichaceae bacterium]
MTKPTYYITTAIAYTSGKPHIGNIYEIVLADSIARYRRQEGYDVYFMTGTDEHGQKIEEKAKAAGKTPQVFVDEVAGVIRGLFDLMNTSYDKFIRTTDPYHELQVQKIFKRLYEQGDIYKDIYEGWYCTPCESFYTDTQLVDGKCPDCGGDVHRAKEESYFFKLSNYTDRLVKYIEDNPSFIQPESRKNEMMNNFIKPGLQDLCVSRTSFKWGIPVTFDLDHVVYVWIDALSNYITGIGYDVDGNHGEIFKKYWPADVHLIGKDILRFHTIYWPIMLMALEIELPKQVFGHPWLLVGEGKMSKSKGNVIYADDLVGLFGVDAVRYLMLHEMPFAQDGTLTYDLMVERINTDLANILGNLVNRTLTMTNKYFNGVVNNPRVNAHPDQELIDLALETVKKADAHMANLRVQDAIDDVLDLLRRSNKYIDETQPWVIARTPEDLPRLQTVIYNLLEAIRFAAVLLESFIPETSKSILDQLNTSQRDKQSLASFGNLEENTKVTEQPTILFARLDPKEVFEKLTPAPKKLETKPEITIEDFAKIDLRVGKILSCQKHPSAEKLLVSQVQVGPEVRQIVSGIATHFTPESLVGKKVIVVANLKAAKLRGELSQGMLLVGEEGETLEILSVDTLSEGSIVR